MSEQPKPLRLGIVMAGAVSAGAYQGGVMDYLFQVMNAWQKAKDAKLAGIPGHDVRFDILSGASAGGMTAGMVCASLQQVPRPVTFDKRKDEEYKKQNVLYNAWVNLVSDTMIANLMSTDDIKREGKVISALNADFITQITDREIRNGKFPVESYPAYVNRRMQV